MAKKKNVDLATWKIIPGLPPADIEEPDPIIQELVGSTIVAFGDISDFPGRNIEGGLAIDYIKPCESVPRRVVFGFTELGMWVEYPEQPE